MAKLIKLARIPAVSGRRPLREAVQPSGSISSWWIAQFRRAVGGIVGNEVAAALCGVENAPRIHNHALGLGGRDIPETVYADLLAAIEKPDAPPFSVFDADLDKLVPEDR